MAPTPEERLQAIASEFGASDIKIFYKRDRVYPDKPVSEGTVDQIERALRSPETETASLRVTQRGEMLYRSTEGVVTHDVQGIGAQFKPEPSQSQGQSEYLNLLNTRYEVFADQPYTETSLRSEIVRESQQWQTKNLGLNYDETVIGVAADRGLTRNETVTILSQSPGLNEFLKLQPTPKEISGYQKALERRIEEVYGPKQEVNLTTSQGLNDKPQTTEAAVRQAIEPKLAEQLNTPLAVNVPAASSIDITSPTGINLERGGAIVLANQSTAIIPVEPTPQQLDQRMPAVLCVQGKANNIVLKEPVRESLKEPMVAEQPVAQASLEKALAAANARIDALETQLDATKGSLQDLKQHVNDSNLKTWAKNTAQKVGMTTQAIVVQAKTKVVEWVQTSVTRVRAVLQEKGTQVQSAAQQTVTQAKAVAQAKATQFASSAELKAIAVRESVRHRLNDALSPVNTAALTATAHKVIDGWGKDGRFEGNTFDFRRSEQGEISIHTKDGKPVFQNGVVSKTADAKTIAHLAKLPSRLEATQKYQAVQANTPKREFAR